MKGKLKTAVCALILIFAVLQGTEQLVYFGEWKDCIYYRLNAEVAMDDAVRLQTLADRKQPGLEQQASVDGKQPGLEQRTSADEELPDLVLWNQEENLTISVREPAERECRVNVITICGNPECLTGNFSIPQYGDTWNCLLDSKSAWKLFGTEEAEGQVIQYQQKEYRVKGILEDVDPTLLLQAPYGYKGKFNRMTVRDNGEIQSWELENTLRSKYGISAEKSDWGLIRYFVKALFCAAVFYLYFSVTGKILGKVSKQDSGKIKKYRRTIKNVNRAAGILLFIILLWKTGMLEISAEYIPPQWSDFDFYKRMWSDMGQSVKALLYMGLSTIELRILWNCILLCTDILLACMALLSICRCVFRDFGRNRAKTLRGIMTYEQ